MKFLIIVRTSDYNQLILEKISWLIMHNKKKLLDTPEFYKLIM